jgi:AcrR family transcriptional regulator
MNGKEVFMYKLCKTERSAKRQREIELELLQMMGSKPYEEITVTELCDALFMPRKAFYRYFDSKEDALQALIDHTMMDYQREVNNHHSPLFPRSLRTELAQFFAFWKKKRILLDTLEQNNLTGLLLQSCLKFPVQDSALLEKFLPSDLEWVRPHIFRFAISGLFTIMMEWYRTGFETDIERMAMLACRMVTTPLFPDLNSLGFVK